MCKQIWLGVLILILYEEATIQPKDQAAHTALAQYDRDGDNFTSFL